jgi:hypothetical protein
MAAAKGHRIWGAALFMASVVPALICSLVFTTWLPSQVERYRDYVAAEPCTAVRAAQPWEDCLRAVPFLVEDVKITRKRSEGYLAFLDGSPFWNGRVEFGGADPLLEQLEPGDRVTGTVWRGDVTVLARGSLRQSTSEEPRDEAQMTAAVGTIPGLLAALGFGFGARRLAGLGGRGPYTWRSFGKPLFVTLLIACFAVGFLALWLGVPWWTVPPVAVLAVVGVAGLLHRHRRPSTHPLGPVLDPPQPDLGRQ